MGAGGRLGPAAHERFNRVAARAQSISNSALDFLFDACSWVLEPRHAAHLRVGAHGSRHDARIDHPQSVDSNRATVRVDHRSAIGERTDLTGADRSADGVALGLQPGIEVGSVGQVGQGRDVVSGSEVVRDGRQSSVSGHLPWPDDPLLVGVGRDRSPPGS